MEGKKLPFKRVMERSPFSMQLFAPDGSCLHANPAWEELWGTSRKALENYNILEDKQLHAAEIADRLQGVFSGKAMKTEAFYYDPAISGHSGRARWIESFAYPRRDATGNVHEIVLVHNDVTDRKQAEEKLKSSEERWRAMAELMPQKIFTTTADGHIDYCNPQWEAYSGQPLESLMGTGLSRLLHSDDFGEHKRRWWRAMRTGSLYEHEHRLRRHDGTYRWHITRVSPVRGAAGLITYWIGSSADVEATKRTMQRNHELEVMAAGLEDQRRQLQELSDTKDEFISLASHQLRTPATGVKQYVGMLLDGAGGELSDTQRLFLQQAYQSNERQLTIVDNLLQVAQIDAGNLRLDLQKTDLVWLAKDIVKEQQAKFRSRRQTISFSSSRKQIIAHVDQVRLRMVFDNLADNASKYTAEQKTIHFKITKPGGTANIAVTDQGVGIAPADKSKIFQKFFRLRNISSDGSGLGLYWGKRVVDLHGGDITVDSQPGKGSTFTVKLPL